MDHVETLCISVMALALCAMIAWYVRDHRNWQVYLAEQDRCDLEKRAAHLEAE